MPATKRRGGEAGKAQEVIAERERIRTRGPERRARSPQRSTAVVYLGIVRDFVLKCFLWVRKPERCWLILFIPTFFRYMQLLRSSLRPRPVLVGGVTSLSESFSSIVDAQAKVELVVEGLSGYLETPVWRHDPELGRGYLLFSQPLQNRLWKWEEGGGAFTIGRSLFLNHAGCTAPPSLPGESGELGICSALDTPGVRGLSLVPTREKDALRLLVLSEQGNLRVSRMELNGTRTTLAKSRTTADSGMDGKSAAVRPLQGPRAVAFSPDGDMLFTDSPPSAASPSSDTITTDSGDPPEALEPSGAIVRISRTTVKTASQDPTASLPSAPEIVSGLVLPRGVAFSCDYSKLYVAEADPSNPRWLVFNVTDDTLSEPEVFAEAKSFQGAGEPDGVLVDAKCNVYLPGPGGILVFDREGRHQGTISTGTQATGVTIGGDGFLYITGSGNVFRVRSHAKPMAALVLDVKS